MGRDIAIPTPLGPINAWRADPPNGAAAFGAILVIQEIFGVNEHIRSVANRYATQGYTALAPSLFDPVQRHVELGYDEAGFAAGRALVTELGTERALQQLAAAVALLRGEGHKVAAVGFCWGGTLAFLANTRLGLPAVSFYGARTLPFLDEPLQAPMRFHFGEDDASIPAADIAQHQLLQPNAELQVYPGGHAFNRDVDPGHYHAESASQARRDTLRFLESTLS